MLAFHWLLPSAPHGGQRREFHCKFMRLPGKSHELGGIRKWDQGHEGLKFVPQVLPGFAELQGFRKGHVNFLAAWFISAANALPNS